MKKLRLSVLICLGLIALHIRLELAGLTERQYHTPEHPSILAMIFPNGILTIVIQTIKGRASIVKPIIKTQAGMASIVKPILSYQLNEIDLLARSRQEKIVQELCLQ
jgi:hypothetical protein